jgi:hypothetical protein
MFVDMLCSSISASNVDAELLIVEWNPPPNRARLIDAVSWPKYMRKGSLRVVTVPESIHMSLPNSDKMPIFEYIAKNVGIRRAKGKHIVATNPDIIFCSSMVTYLSSDSNLDSQMFYRANRYDVAKEIPLSGTREIENFCKLNWSAVHDRAGRFGRSEYNWFNKCGIYFNSNLTAAKLVHDFMPYPYSIHTYTSGDFMLMSKENWLRMRAYPELKTHGHIDDYMCFLASLFLKQRVLPYPIYHQEHSKHEQKGRPETDQRGIYKLFSQSNSVQNIEAEKLTPNTDEWGLGGTILPEETA